MRAAMEAHGQLVVDDAPQSEPTEEAGVSPSPEGESEPVAEPGTTQEVVETPAPAAAAKPPEPVSDKGKFLSRKDKAEREVSRLRDTLEDERGDRARLQEKLAAAEAEVQRLKPAEAAPPDSGPVKPKRPTLEQAEYDQAKYEAMLDQHDEDMAAYHAKLGEKVVKDTLAAEEQKRRDREVAEAQERANQEFAGRVAAGAKAFDDYYDLVEAMPEKPVETPAALDGAIEVSSNPAMLIRYFMLDHVTEGGKELARISRMNPLAIVREVTLLERKLLDESAAAGAAPPVADPAPAPAPVARVPAVPARPKLRTPTEPIEPVGSRAGAGSAKLSDAKAFKDYLGLRSPGLNR